LITQVNYEQTNVILCVAFVFVCCINSPTLDINNLIYICARIDLDC